MHVPLKEKRRGGKGRKKKSRILAKLVYVHEGKEVSNSGRVELKNPHYFAGCYEDTEELFLEVLEYLEENYDLDAVEAIFLCGDGAPWIKKGLEIIPQSIFILPRFHLAQRIQGACPEPHKRGELWKAIEEGSWEEVEALLLKALSQRKNPRDQRGLENLSIYLSWKLERESRMPETPRLQSVPKPMAASPPSSTLPSSHGLREERGRPRISSEL